jgi:heterodisulfide reductase subunit C
VGRETIIDRMAREGIDNPKSNVQNYHRFLKDEIYKSGKKSECANNRHMKCKKPIVFPTFKRRTVSIEKDSTVGREIIDQRTVRT